MAALITACDNSGNNTPGSKQISDSAVSGDQTGNTTQAQPVSSNDVVTAYLQLKNALATDNSKEAANAGKQLNAAMQGLDGASLTVDQKGVYDEVKEDIKEHAEHISTNANNIGHQREHFDILSQDIYDLVKSVKSSQPLYKDFCPMYNGKKGAIWLSETKEIKNPYYGKEMLTCGEVKEEINQ